MWFTCVVSFGIGMLIFEVGWSFVVPWWRRRKLVKNLKVYDSSMSKAKETISEMLSRNEEMKAMCMASMDLSSAVVYLGSVEATERQMRKALQDVDDIVTKCMKPLAK